MNIIFRTYIILPLFILLFNITNSFGQNDFAILNKAKEQALMGNVKEAIKTLKYNPTPSPESIELLIELYLKQGEPKKCDSIINLVSNKILNSFLRAQVLQQSGKFEESLEILSQIEIPKTDSDVLKYKIIKSLGISNWLQGNTTLAEFYLTEYHKNYAEKQNSISGSLNNLGLLYLNDQPARAISYFQQGINSWLTTDGVFTKISLKNNLALAYKFDNQIQKAVETFENSLLDLLNIQSNTPLQAYILNNLSELYFESNKFELANQKNTEASNILKSFYGSAHPEISNSMNLKASYLNFSQKHKEAHKIIYEAYKYNSFDIENDVKSILSPYYKNFKTQINNKTYIETLIYEAETWEFIYYNKNPKLSYLKLALHIYQRADSILTQIKNTTQLEKDKIALGKISTKLYDKAIATSIKIAEFDPLNAKKYKELAFIFSESNKSSILKSAIHESKSKKFAGIPDSILKKEAELKSQISYFELYKTTSQNANTSLIKLYKEKFDFLKTLESKYPKYYQLKYQKSVLSINDIQKALEENQQIISYHVSENNLMLYCFQISKNKFEIHENPIDQKFSKKLLSMRNSINFNDSKLLCKVNNELNDKLIPFKAKENTHLIIIPDSRMSNIPFEALFLSDSKSETPYNEMDFLIRHYPISYSYSVELFLDQIDSKKEFPKEALLCSPVEYKDLQLTPLTGAEKEIKCVDSILKSNYFKNKILLNEAATETEFKQALLKPYSFIMVSSHGIVNETTPDKSEIFFNPSKSDDGNLYANEIFNLEINTSILLLPCCQTASGKIVKGEGVIGLSRALLYAGVGNMILSLWNISDNFSTQFSKQFFENIITNKYSNAKNMQIVKKSFINKGDNANPFYWSPYILIGK